MSDDALRALEREARSAGDGVAVLRLAAALDRAGRPAEAFAALAAGRADPAVRAALGARPLEPGPPITVRPAIRWRRKQAGTDRVTYFAAGPLGVVLGSKAKLRVLDPDDGATRFELKGSPFQALVGDALLTVRGKRARLEAFDVWTGERLYDAPLEGLCTRTVVTSRWLLQETKGGLACYDLAEPRRPPVFAWHRERSERPGEGLPEPLWLPRARGDHALAQGASGALSILDLRTGVATPVDHDGRWLALGDGVALAAGHVEEYVVPPSTLVAFGLDDGARRWTGPERAWTHAHVTRGGVVAASDPDGSWGPRDIERLDVATGEERGRCQPEFGTDLGLPGDGVDYLVSTSRMWVTAWPHGAPDGRPPGPPSGVRARVPALRRPPGPGRLGWSWIQYPTMDVQGAVACLGRIYLMIGRATPLCLEAPA